MTNNLTKPQALAIWKTIKTLNRNLARADEGDRMNVSDIEDILELITTTFPDIESKKKADL